MTAMILMCIRREAKTCIDFDASMGVEAMLFALARLLLCMRHDHAQTSSTFYVCKLDCTMKRETTA